MAKRIYVGNLPDGTDESKLKDIFSLHGQVGDVRLIGDQETGRPSGHAFVEMPDDANAGRAILQLNGADMGGRALVVTEARARR